MTKARFIRENIYDCVENTIFDNCKIINKFIW